MLVKIFYSDKKFITISSTQMIKKIQSVCEWILKERLGFNTNDIDIRSICLVASTFLNFHYHIHRSLVKGQLALQKSNNSSIKSLNSYWNVNNFSQLPTTLRLSQTSKLLPPWQTKQILQTIEVLKI